MEKESPYFSSVRRGIKRSVSEFPPTLSIDEFYPSKKFRKLTPDAKLRECPEINRLSDQLRNKAFFMPSETSPKAKKSLFNAEATKKPENSGPDNVCIPSALSPGGTVESRIRLRSPSELEPRFKDVFSFRFFNIVQSSIFDYAFGDDSLVVSSPTGSGKTVIFELAIIKEIRKNPGGLSKKIIYFAPIKALVSEKAIEWSRKFERVGIKVLEFTGDFSGNENRRLLEGDIILTTPEKWDVITRLKNNLVQPSLVLIDEVHQLSDISRGHTLEAVISRIKLTSVSKVRFIAISATIPNGKDIALWLNDAKYFFFDETKRPVPLKKIVLGYPKGQSVNPFLFEMRLSYKLSNLIRNYSNGKPTLVFTNTRKSAQNTASVIAKDLRLNCSKYLLYFCKNVSDTKLREALQSGVGFHHAGLESRDRKIVEEIFLQGDLPVLTCTSTLAQGVNLPAHLVIIKGTMQSTVGVSREYDHSQIQQMIGRAGRPQFDTSATALILTTTANQDYYGKILTGSKDIESWLHSKLTEHLNTEIVLKNITNTETAIAWAKESFLYFRIKKNPRFYKIQENPTNTEAIENKFVDLIKKNLQDLLSICLINTSPSTGRVWSTPTGKIMSRFCIAFLTMKNLSDMDGNEEIPGLISIFSMSEEYSEIILRRNEKEHLNKLNKPGNNTKGIRFPFKNKIKSNSMKISVLVQATFGCLPINDASLAREANRCLMIGQRISKAFLELLWNNPDAIKDELLYKAITLNQCFQSGLWENSIYVTKQLPRIGLTYSSLLAHAGYTTFEKILSVNARTLELATNRPPPFGNHVQCSASKMPKYVVDYYDNGSVVIDIATPREEIVSGRLLFVLITNEDSNEFKIISKHKVQEDKMPHAVYLNETQLTNVHNLNIRFLSSVLCGVDLHRVFPLKSTNVELLEKSYTKKSPHKKSNPELTQSFIDISTMKITKFNESFHRKAPDAVTFNIDFDESMPDWENDNLLDELIVERKINEVPHENKELQNMSLGSSFESKQTPIKRRKMSGSNASISGRSSAISPLRSTDEIMNISDETPSDNNCSIDSSLNSTKSLAMTFEEDQNDKTRPEPPQQSIYFSSKIFMNLPLHKRLGLL